MSEIAEKSIRTLELGAILDMLAHECVSEEAKKRALQIRPLGDASEVARLQSQTSAATGFISLFGTPPLSGIRDIRLCVMRAEKGGVLSNRELMDIAMLLGTVRSVRKYEDEAKKDATCIDQIFRSLIPNKFLEDKINRIVISEDEISDDASSTLSDIRRHMRIASTKARESLQKIITSSHYSKYLQEPIITMRSARYVVPVRSEYKNEIPGLIHDVSSSGATFFVEPMSTVQANNELRELLSKEKKEIERILAELSSDAAGFAEDLLLNFELLVQLDSIFARGKLSYRLKCVEPVISEYAGLELIRARHPLLDQSKAVPITLSLGKTFDTLVITGPNTGGKTVALKTIGLLSLMACCGLHIPADDGSSVFVYEKIFADIGDEQSIEQSLSTFSSHMKNIVAICEAAQERSLVLFDELGAGTDPVEGAALAIAVIEYVRSRGAHVAATTHYAELKVYAMSADFVENASCEFDVDSLKPTYRLLIGIPGKSNAFAISRRLGLPEEIIARARERIDKESADFEDVLSRLEQQRSQMEKARLEAEQLARETEKNNETSKRYREQIELEREKVTALARKEAQSIIDETRLAVQEVLREINDLRRSAEKSVDWQRVNEARAQLGQRLNRMEEQLGTHQTEEVPPPSPRAVKPGDTVRIIKFGTTGTVLSVDRDRNLTVQAGILKVSVREDEVRLEENSGKSELRKYMAKSESSLQNLPVSREVDLRGMLPEEATFSLQKYLDAAYRAHLEEVRIIHGKGTGVLRQAVAAYLKNDPHVLSFRPGRYGEGETGVTVAQLK